MPTTAAKGKGKESDDNISVPDDIIREVVLLLPWRSIAQFRCVCRFWNAETSSPSFLDRAATKFAFVPRCPWGSCSDLPCPRLIGAKHCRGVVLVEQHQGRWPTYAMKPPLPPFFLVCNPTTGGVLRLPPPPPPPPSGDGGHAGIVSGIGYHQGEYKVVSAVLGNKQGRVITVGDVSRGWRTLQQFADSQADDDDGTIDGNIDPAFADGYIHWCLFGSHGGIVSFSVADESFRRVPPPPFVDAAAQHPSREKQRLAELNGRLCVVRDVRCRDDVPGQFEVWKLHDYEMAANTIWSLDYRVELTGRVARRMRGPSFVVPFKYIPAGNGDGEKRKMLLATSDHRLQVYDPNTNSLRTVAGMAGRRARLDINRGLVSRCDSSIRILMYQESHVRFPGMELDAKKNWSISIRFDELEYINKV